MSLLLHHYLPTVFYNVSLLFARLAVPVYILILIHWHQTQWLYGFSFARERSHLTGGLIMNLRTIGPLMTKLVLEDFVLRLIISSITAK